MKINKMKKRLIREAFRLQQLAGIAPINEINSSSVEQVYDSAIKDAIENFAEENYEEGTIESVADVVSLMQTDSVLANDVFQRALIYVQEKLGNVNKEDFKIWFSDVAAPVSELNEGQIGDFDDFADIYRDRVSVTDEGEYYAQDSSDREAVELADALTALYDEHGENGVDLWLSGELEIKDFM